MRFIYSDNRFPQVRFAVDQAEILLSDDNFYKEISKKRNFRKTRASPKQIASFIEENKLVLVIQLYESKQIRTKTLAYYSSKHPNTIFLNTRNLERSVASIVGTLIHEYVHAIDRHVKEYRFGHGSNSRIGKKNTAPYWIGNLASRMSLANQSTTSYIKSIPLTEEGNSYYHDLLENDFEDVSIEGVPILDEEIISFKASQKLTNTESNTEFKGGGFVYGNASLKKFSTHYSLMMFSNKYKISSDEKTFRRYGYGIELILDVFDIETEIGFDYGTLAAAADLGVAKVNYRLQVHGGNDMKNINYLPTNGAFNNETYKELTDVVIKMKDYLKNNATNKLFPIEIIKSKKIDLEKIDFKTAYFAVKNISKGKQLQTTISKAKRGDYQHNKNVIQFIYSYFGLDNAYSSPNKFQIKNALDWLNGKYNMTKESDYGDISSWVEVEPGTLQDGTFSVLSYLPNSEAYSPHLPPTNWNDLAKSTDTDFRYTSLDFSSSLKIASVLDTNAKFNTITKTVNFVRYVPISENRPQGSKVLETKYGVGLRLKYHISNYDFGVDLNFGTIGLASELGHVNVDFEITGIGIPDTDILELLPNPQVITQDSLENINKSFDAIKQKIATLDVSQFTPQAYSIKVDEPQKVDPTIDAQGYVFAMKKVANRRTKLGDALNAGKKLNIKEKSIRACYAEFDIYDLHQKPKFSDKKEAREWLNDWE